MSVKTVKTSSYTYKGNSTELNNDLLTSNENCLQVCV